MFCRGWDGEVELENVDFRLENEAGRKEQKVGTIPTKNGLIMAQSIQTGISHKNNLSGYIGNWLTVMNHFKRTQPPIRIPRAVVSYNDNTYDLSLMLSYLDNNLTILEKTPLAPDTFDYLAYAQARSFLKVCYLLLRILLDDVFGIIKYFYDYNESGVIAKKDESFNDLLKKVDTTNYLETLLRYCSHQRNGSVR